MSDIFQVHLKRLYTLVDLQKAMEQGLTIYAVEPILEVEGGSGESNKTEGTPEGKSAAAEESTDKEL